MKKTIERYSFLILVLIVLGGLFFGYYAWAYNPGTNITLCTGGVTQPACYSTAYPSPTVSWTIAGSSSQSAYQVQIDQNQNFNNIEVDSGTVSSGSNSYEAGVNVINFGQTVYWRVRVTDNFSSLTDWAVADSSFTANLACDTAPTATSLTVVQGDYCSTASHYFSWVYSDNEADSESRFEFEVDNNADFSSPEVDRDYADLSNPSPTTNNQTVVVAVSPFSDQIGYNTTYYWRVKVYHDGGKDSDWVEGSSFTTQTHQYPTVDFTWTPQSPSQDEEVQFTDQSTVYGGATKSIWSWTFEDGNPAVSSDQNSIIQFTSNGSKNVVLDITDSDGFSCDNSADPEIVNVLYQLPDWKEVTPR